MYVFRQLSLKNHKCCVICICCVFIDSLPAEKTMIVFLTKETHMAIHPIELQWQKGASYGSPLQLMSWSPDGNLNRTTFINWSVVLDTTDK